MPAIVPILVGIVVVSALVFGTACDISRAWPQKQPQPPPEESDEPVDTDLPPEETTWLVVEAEPQLWKDDSENEGDSTE